MLLLFASANVQRPLHLQHQRGQPEHRAGRAREVRGIGKPGRVGRAGKRLAVREQRPRVQQPAPQHVGAQRQPVCSTKRCRKRPGDRFAALATSGSDTVWSTRWRMYSAAASTRRSEGGSRGVVPDTSRTSCIQTTLPSGVSGSMNRTTLKLQALTSMVWTAREGTSAAAHGRHSHACRTARAGRARR